MVYRFLMFLKSFLNSSFLCQTCGNKSEDYKNSAVIKVKHANGAIADLLICKSCADKLEGKKGKK
jgi:predicted metal-binding protein